MSGCSKCFSICVCLRGESQENEQNQKQEANGLVTENRKCTDVGWLGFMIFFFISVLAIITYCGLHSDVFRVINGYDNCGHVCGKDNPDTKEKFACKGVDHRSRPFLLIRGTGRAILNPVHSRRECISNCSAYPGFRRFITRCVPIPGGEVAISGIEKATSAFSFVGLSDFFEETYEDLHLCLKEMGIMCLVALGFSFILLLLFRYLIGFVIWFVLVGVVVASVASTVYLWILWKRESDEVNQGEFPSDLERGLVNSYLIFAITATIVTVIVILIILVMRKRIGLLVQLFKEAGKAVASMPLLLFQPVLAFWVICFVAVSWIYFTLVIQGSGFLAEKNFGNLYYKKDFAMKFSRWYNLFGMLWFVQFVIGCQQLVIAGAVARWFFTRDKNNLDSPILRSFSKMLNYHLGSVAFGSLVIALAQMIRAVLTFIEAKCKKSQYRVFKWIAAISQCCLSCCESALKYVTRNSYIETAIYGVDFCTGGKKAFRLISSNILRVATINSVGDFILFLGKMLVVISTVIVGIVILKDREGILHVWVPVAVAGVFAYIVSHCFITVYEMVIDTIFVCFCEDYEMNDGVNKPYYMSRGLMEFVQNSKNSLPKHRNNSQ